MGNEVKGQKARLRIENCVKGTSSKAARNAAKEFVAYKRKHPTGSIPLTALQKRMQSGGA